MGEILEALYEGRLKAEPVIEKRNEKYQKACKASQALLEELSGKLNSEDQKLLNRVVEALYHENYCYTVDRFVRGYRLGALMILEVMEDRKDFVWKEIFDGNIEGPL